MGDKNGSGGTLSDGELNNQLGVGDTYQPPAPATNDSASQQAQADAAAIDKAYGDK